MLLFESFSAFFCFDSSLAIKQTFLFLTPLTFTRTKPPTLKVSSYFHVRGLVVWSSSCECVKKGNEYTFEVDHAEETPFFRSLNGRNATQPFESSSCMPFVVVFIVSLFQQQHFVSLFLSVVFGSKRYRNRNKGAVAGKILKDMLKCASREHHIKNY